MQITATQNSICSNKSICLVSKSIYPSFHASQSQSALVNLSANASYFKRGLPVLKYKHRRVGLKHQHTPIVSLFGSKGKDSGDGVRTSLSICFSDITISKIYSLLLCSACSTLFRFLLSSFFLYLFLNCYLGSVRRIENIYNLVSNIL